MGSVIVDGETHRGKLVAKEATDRISQLTEFKEKEDDVFSNIAEKYSRKAVIYKRSIQLNNISVR